MAKQNENAINNEEEKAGISRRSFLSAGALMAGTMAMFGAGCAPKDAPQPTAEAAEKLSDTGNTVGGDSVSGWAGTPPELEAVGWSTMPLATLNEYRRQYIDAQKPYTCEDGTVIPEHIVKVRALIHTFGVGAGNTPNDTVWPEMLDAFDEDAADVFLSAPWGEVFTALDVVAATGRPLDEVEKLLQHIADRGFLCRFERSKGTCYHHVPMGQGIAEYAMHRVMEGGSFGVVGNDWLGDDTGTGFMDWRDSGSPIFYAIPCSKDVVADDGIPTFDDFEQIIMSKNTVALAPCNCRYTALARAGLTDIPSFEDFASGEFYDYKSPLCDQRVETCIMTGDEADFWVSLGQARYITKEEAIAHLKRMVDDGFIMESAFQKDTETICCCHHKSCDIVHFWQAIGEPEDIAASKAFSRISHYTLEVDFDKCVKCGTCAERCPLQSITMDGMGGAPQVNDFCYRCGQCAYVCPQEARKLVMRPEDEQFDLPRDFLDDANMKAAYRFEHDQVVPLDYDTADTSFKGYFADMMALAMAAAEGGEQA